MPCMRVRTLTDLLIVCYRTHTNAEDLSLHNKFADHMLRQLT